MTESYPAKYFSYCRCVVPPVTVLSPILDYGRCFLRHPYEHSVKLHNDSDLPAKYELLPQNINEDTPILYSSPKSKVCLLEFAVLGAYYLIQEKLFQSVNYYIYVFTGNCGTPLVV